MKAAALIVSLFAATTANAGANLRLEFDRQPGAEACPDQETFDAIVVSRIGSVAWSADAPRAVRVSFFAPAAADGRLSGRMELVEGGAVLGVRDVRAPGSGCQELAEALGLAVSLVVDPPGAPKALVDAQQEREVLEPVPGSARAEEDAAAFASITRAPAVPELSAPTRVVPPKIRIPGNPIPVMLFAGSEGAYSIWSGGTKGDDEHHQSIAYSGDLYAGGEAPMGRGYTLEVLVGGYTANRRDRRGYLDFEEYGRDGSGADYLDVHQSVGATAMRTSMRFDSEETAVSLGVLVGGFRQHGCHQQRVREWHTPLCGDVQQWVAFPTFGARMGHASGPYATIGILDGRSLGGELAHLGVGAILPGDRRVDTSIVAAAEGVGLRLKLEAPIGPDLVLMPSISGGLVYDTFISGGRNNWIRAGCVVALRR